MSEASIILRKWSGRIRTADEEEYVAYIARTGLDEYKTTEGNLGYQMLMRALGDGASEVTTLSWWRDMDAVRGFAGNDPERAVYYPEDDRFLLERPEFVEHHRVLAGEVSLTAGARD
jgi:heme-degrading monooxygenase HmoA